MKELKYNGTVCDDYGKSHHCIGTKKDNESLMGEYGFYGDEKDAKLIAAAPDLLKALQAIRTHWSNGNFSRDINLWKAMDEAIKKALD